MVADFDEGRILGELQDLEDEIEAVETTLTHALWATHVYSEKRRVAFSKLLDELVHRQDRLIEKLKIHRQKVKESGIKY